MTHSITKKDQFNNAVSLLLQEYSYIQELEIYNKKNGDTRFNYYLTFISIISTGLLVYWVNIDQHSLSEVQNFNILSFSMMLIILFVGWQILIMFIERWCLTIINLRKLARIRKWFLERTPCIKRGLVSGVDDTKPLFTTKKFFSSSLLTLISVFNSISFSIVIIQMLKIISLFIDSNLLNYLLLIICFILMMIMQYYFYRMKINRFEEDKSIAFPDYLV